MGNRVSEWDNHQSTAIWDGKARIFFHRSQYQDDHLYNGITDKTDHGINSE